MTTPEPDPDTVLHVINHTHWDREWFVPFTVTSRWIPNLIRNLQRVVQRNPRYSFLFDAQTMVIEDLEATDQAAYDLARHLINDHHLAIGPYYAQVEMRSSAAESLIRNLRLGTDKARALGASTDFVAWNVDYFGHVSQSPQIHALFGITDAYLWRGPNQLEPFFWWQGPDKTTMLAIDLFAGGYRNFYKVASKDELALPRLEHEVKKLRPYYIAGHIPVFDGFDLDKEPGDAASYFSRHYHEHLKAERIRVTNSTPLHFARTIRQLDLDLPTMNGELISGKYSSVFPGSLSTRIYAKLLADQTEQLLYRYAEPLSLLLRPEQYPSRLFEQQTKLIIQNLVHDVISGCSIDQVHDYAELRTRRIRQTLKRNVTASLTKATSELTDGTYAYIPTTGRTDVAVALGTSVYRVAGNGVEITKVTKQTPLGPRKRQASTFSWTNQHYQAKLDPLGVLTIGEGHFGQLVVRRDDGDTYWEEPVGEAETLTISSPLEIIHEAPGYAEVAFAARTRSASRFIRARVHLVFDHSPLIRWRIELKTKGIGYSVALRHQYAHAIDQLQVGMQFDNVIRRFEDDDLLGEQLEGPISSLLIGQRDIIKTFTFPFHSYVTPTNNPDGVHILAKGLRAYQTTRPATIDLVLRRPVEWVMKPGRHRYHTGDAGPKYLVPGARSQRRTTIDCGLLVDRDGPDTIKFHQAVDRFLNPPLLFQVKGSAGTRDRLTIFDESVPITSLHQYQGQRLARIYNPTSYKIDLEKPHASLANDHLSSSTITGLGPKQIASVAVQPPVTSAPVLNSPTLTILNWPQSPVGPDRSKPDPVSIAQLAAMRSRLKHERDSLKSIIDHYGAGAPNRLLHRFYVVSREYMEAELSLKWNRQRTDAPSPLADPYKIDNELYRLATDYNDMRIIRRVYDYVVDLDSHGEPEVRPKQAPSRSAQRVVQ